MARNVEQRRAYYKAWRDANRAKIRTTNSKYYKKLRARFPELGIWLGIKSRCYSPQSPGFKFYGDRGIIICDRWRCSFWHFLEDVGRRPDPNLTIERIDNNGNYEPGNVRWASRKDQALNTRSVRLITIDGTTDSLTSWGKRFGLTQKTLERRLLAGWHILDALCAPPNYRKLTFRSKTDDEIGIPRALGLNIADVIGR